MTLLRRLGTWISNKVYASGMLLALTVIGLGMAGAAVPAAAPSTEVCDAAAEPAAELVPR